MKVFIILLVFMPMAAAFLSFAIGKRDKLKRNSFVLAVCAAEFLFSLLLFIKIAMGESTQIFIPYICKMGLNFTVDGFRAVYAVIAAFMWLMTIMLSEQYFAHYRNRNRYYLFQLITLGATEAIFLSADLFTTFIFFEIMSLCSYVWVVQDEKAESLKAGETYLAVAVIGGMVLLMGLFLLYHQAGTLMISELPTACEGKNVFAAALCMLTGFGAKAGAFPVHIWLPKAHPVAPAPASALLSGILTKTGVFGILVISCKMLISNELWGAVMLVIGVITMFLGAVLALFSINFKRTLACSSVSQIGFILVGVAMITLLGEHNTLAVRGTFLHMVNHSCFKLILFMAAGVIYMNTHKLDINDIRGFGRGKKPLIFAFLMGALGIGGIPLFSGYISKTLLHESIVEYIKGLEHGEFISHYFSAFGLKAVEWVFLISGGITIAYMTKLFVAVFVEKNNDPDIQRKFDENSACMNKKSFAALIISSVVVPVFGVLPHFTMDKLADTAQSFMGVLHLNHAVHYFALVNLKGAAISVCIGAALYLAVVRGVMMKNQPDGAQEYVDIWPSFFDLEEKFYRPLLQRALPFIFGRICSLLDGFVDRLAKILPVIGAFIAGCMDIMVDLSVVILRSSVYRDSPRRGELEEGNAMTHVIGVFLNRLEQLLNKTVWKNREHKIDLEHWFVLKYVSFKENTTVISRSLSYGLISFSLGLCATLIYLLVAAFL